MPSDFCELRDRCGLELADIAAEFDESLDSVWLWENGVIAPPDKVLRSLTVMADFSSHSGDVRAKNIVLESKGARAPVEHPAERQRKSQLGQFMTPRSIANFMASLFDPARSSAIRLLDPGAGQGALTNAFVDRFSSTAGLTQIKTTVCEMDDLILPALQATLAALAERTAFEFELIEGEFIEEAANRICLGNGARYTHAILNPPYKKIAAESKYRTLLRACGLETVNLYSGFVGMALELLEPRGELVTIIPRSFCNGPYYQPFRRFILRRASIQHIHLFDSRDNAFKDDGVLQENIILKLTRGQAQGRVTISTSTDSSFADYEEKQHDFSRIVFHDDSNEFIHIPTGEDQQLLENANFGYSLVDLGLTVSTGPIVDFRLRENLCADPEHDTVPLLYPGHFGTDGLRWPKAGFKKPNAIRHNMTTRKWLYPGGFYTVVRRFSSKEERRRIVANVIDPARLGAPMIGIENHLNVFHAKRQPISEVLAHGLAAYLNATAVDTYFRRFNGHTQVNATDLRAMRYPSREALIALGEWAKGQATMSQDEIDERVNTL